MNLSKYKHIVFSMATSGLLSIGLFLLLNGAPQIAHADSDDLFVTTDGSGIACAQATPCDLATALTQSTDGDTIYVATGTYTGTGAAIITVTHSITFYGGWDGATTTPTVRNPDTHPTTIDGEGARRGVYVNSGITVTLEGFTITNGRVVGNGGGLYAHNVSLTLRGMVFDSNVITDTENNAYGGGAFVEEGVLRVEATTFRGNSARSIHSPAGGGLTISSTLTATVEGSLFLDNDAWHASGIYFLGNTGSHSPFILRNNTFVDNGWDHSPGSAFGGYAGALKVVNAQAHIEGNTFSGNRAANDHGALGIFFSDLLLARNVIYGNQCARTAGLYLHFVSPFTVTNNIIAGNRSTYSNLPYPAVRVRDSDGQFLHNTIARNDSTYGVQVDSGATVALTNTILVSHTVGISVTSGSTAMLDVTLWGSDAWANGTDWGGDGAIVTGTVNIWDDPAFVNPDNENYHIGSGSAARNAGVNAGVIDDIDGDTRPQENDYDIGADEFIQQWYIFLPLVVKN